MSELVFEIATINSLPEILRIYHDARIFMANSGNETQWRNNYPSKEQVLYDIENRQLYIVKKSDMICGVFFFSENEEKTYRKIYDGKWLNDLPYAVIHRIASSGKEKGIANEIFKFCFEKFPNLKIDTHENNKKMRHCLLHFGFVECGTILLEDGTKRIAFQICKK